MSPLKLVEEITENIIAKLTSEYISAHPLTRETVINLRVTLLKLIGTQGKEIDAYLKFIWLCKTREFSLHYQGGSLEDLIPILQSIINLSENTYISINVHGGDKNDCCLNITKLIRQLIQMKNNIFFYRIQAAPSIAKISTWQFDNLDQLIEITFTDAWSFRSVINLANNYYASRHQVLHLYTSLAIPIQHHQHLPEVYPDSSSITLHENIYANTNCGNKERVKYMKHITENKILFDLPEISKRTISSLT